MNQIERLRARLKNVQRNVVEYRMTVAEAKSLLQEIDELTKPVIIEKPAITEQATIVRILDGGTF